MALTIAQLKTLVNNNLADNSNIIPSEHRAVELALIDYLETLQPISTSNLPVNKGYITATSTAGGTIEVGLEIEITLSDKLKCVGNASAATIISNNDGSMLTVTLQNAHPNTNYVVKSWLELVPTSIITLPNTSHVLYPVFKVLSTTQFQIIIKETADQTQALRLHFETIGY